MEVKITTTIEKTIFDSENNNQNNLQKLQSTLIGGTASKYETPASYNPASETVNDFSIKDTQTFEFFLENNNNFNKDIFTLLNTPVADITFIHISCFETKNMTPIKFKLSAEYIGVAQVIELGDMTSFNILNIKSNNITKLFINNIIVPTELQAILVVSVGSKNKNS